MQKICKSKSAIIGISVIALAIAFYTGSLWGKRSFFARNPMSGIQGGPNIKNMKGIGASGMGFVTGEIASIDPNSITVKTMNGSTKIVLVATSTQVSKMTEGSISDLSIGKNISVNGTSNKDGIVTASSIQLRPEMTKQR